MGSGVCGSIARWIEEISEPVALDSLGGKWVFTLDGLGFSPNIL